MGLIDTNKPDISLNDIHRMLERMYGKVEVGIAEHPTQPYYFVNIMRNSDGKIIHKFVFDRNKNLAKQLCFSLISAVLESDERGECIRFMKNL
jgi:hypothetical protein